MERLPLPTLIPLVLAKLRASLNSRTPVRAAGDYSRLTIGSCAFRVLTMLSAADFAEADTATETSALPTLIVAEYIPRQAGLSLRQRGQYYADAMGNAWLEAGSPGPSLLISGERSRRLRPAIIDAAFQPLGLRLLLHLLTTPALAQRPVVELARRTRVPVPAVVGTLADLTAQNYLSECGHLRELPALTARWLRAYATGLRPLLPTRRYRWLTDQQLPPPGLGVAAKARCLLSGPVAAYQLLDCPPAPAAAVRLYAPLNACYALLTRLGLVLDPCGPVEVPRLFSMPAALSRPHCAHPLLVAADTLAAGPGSAPDPDHHQALVEQLLARYLPHLAA